MTCKYKIMFVLAAFAALAALLCSPVKYDNEYDPKSSNYKPPVTVINGKADKEKYPIGATVTITADPPPVSHVFSHWISDSSDIMFIDFEDDTTTFILPARPVTVTGVFVDTTTPPPPPPCTTGVDCPGDPVSCETLGTCAEMTREACAALPGTIVLSCPADTCTTDVNCPGDIINCKTGGVCGPKERAECSGTDDSVVAECPVVTIARVITFNYNGGIVGKERDTTGTDGKLANLPATTRDGYAFDGWWTAETGGAKVSTSTTFTDNATLYARWLFLHTLEVTVIPNNSGTVTRNPISPDRRYPDSTNVTLTAIPVSADYAFSHWIGADGQATDPVKIVTMTDNMELTAVFQLVYEITTVINPSNGGTITLTPERANNYYPAGEVIATAIPNAADGYKFDWWGVGGQTSPNVDTTFRVVNSPVTLTANFALKTYTLTTPINTVGGKDGEVGGTVTLSPNQEIYTHGETVTVTAAAETGYQFTGWTAGEDTVSKDNEFTITMYSDTTLTANFIFIQSHTLTISTNLDEMYSNITITPAPGTHTYNHGTLVTVTAPAAIPNDKYFFQKWVADKGGSLPQDVNETDASITFTIVGDVSIMAVYDTIFIDTRDKQDYPVVKIGEQVWMAKNLNYQMDNSWCHGSYKSDTSTDNCVKYGRLYFQEAAINACPTGWRLPNNDDWNVLINTADKGRNSAAYHLKSTSVWSSNGDDAHGFSALPGGYHYDGVYDQLGEKGHWWSSTAGNRFLIEGNDAKVEGLYPITSRFSVRCIRNVTPGD